MRTRVTPLRGLALALTWSLAAGGVPVARGQVAEAIEVLKRDLSQAAALKAQGRFDEAVPLLESVVTRSARVFGRDHPNVAIALGALGDALVKLRRYDEAGAVARESLAILERAYGPNAPEAALGVLNLATFHQRRDQHAEARPLFERGLRLLAADPKPDIFELAGRSAQMAESIWVLEGADRAEACGLLALRLCEQTFGPDDPRSIQVLFQVADLQLRMGRLVAGVSSLERAAVGLRISARQGKPNALLFAMVLYRLGQAKKGLGLKFEAVGCYGLAIQAMEAAPAPDHDLMAQFLVDRALLHDSIGWVPEAEADCRRAITSYEEHKSGSIELGVALRMLAWVLLRQDKLAEVERLLDRSQEIHAAILPPEDPAMPSLLEVRGKWHEVQGRREEAEVLYERVFQIRLRALGEEDPRTAQSLDNLALNRAGLGRLDQAGADLDRSRRIFRRELQRKLPGLSDVEQIGALWHGFAPDLFEALSLARRHPDDPALAARSAGWVLNGKSLALEAAALQARLGRDAPTAPSEVAKLAEELRTVRDLQAALVVHERRAAEAGPDRQPAAELAEQRQLLGSRAQMVTRRLNDVSLRSGQPRRDPWVELAAVRRALPADAVLIEFVRMSDLPVDVPKANRLWGPFRYLAWVIPPEGHGPVTLIDLGLAKEIDELITTMNRTVIPDLRAIQTGEEAAEEHRFLNTLTPIAERVLRPLLPRIGTTPRWIISPDGPLWLIPWVALPYNGEGYAIEWHEVRLALSGRDLVAPRVEPSRAPPVLFAAVDYDLKLTPNFDRVVPPTDEAAGPATPSIDPFVTHWERLEASGDEAQQIAPLLERSAGATPETFLEDRARESAFKALHRPRALVLSTHGFAQENQAHTKLDDALRRPGPTWSETATTLADHPLLQCGVILAGANGRRARVEPGEDDGVLTALEITNTDLTGTELVFLPSCVTARGEVFDGQGVYGLRQAFHIAGAQTVVATQWNVPDEETAELSIAFFENLAAGMSTGRALRLAQLERIRKHRERPAGAAHPFFWAAFALTAIGSDPREFAEPVDLPAGRDTPAGLGGATPRAPIRVTLRGASGPPPALSPSPPARSEAPGGIALRGGTAFGAVLVLAAGVAIVLARRRRRSDGSADDSAPARPA